MKGIGTVTLAERPTRAVIAALGLAFAGLGGLATPELAVGAVTLAGAAWLLFGLIGLGQLLVAVHLAFRHHAAGGEAD